MKKNICAEVTLCDELKPIFTAPVLGKASNVMLIANTHRTIIRVAELSKRERWLTPKIKWRLVQENFPLGNLINENTHIFDGSMFANNAGKTCFLMAAFPKAASDAVAEMGVEKWGSIHRLRRLDTMEHMLFRHYARLVNKAKGENGRRTKTPEPLWVIFPQGLGFKILHIEDGLPNSVHYISNQPRLCEIELSRVWEEVMPSRVIKLLRGGACGTKDSESVHDSGCKGVCASDSMDADDECGRNCKYAGDIYDSDGLWIDEFIRGRGDLEVERNNLWALPIFKGYKVK